MQFFLKKKPIRGLDGHLRIWITQKCNNTSSEPLEEHFWQVWCLHMRLFWKTSQNVSAYKRQVQPSWISNCFKKIQHFFRNPIETCVVSLVTGHALILRKKLKMWKVYDIWANWWMDGCQTLFDRKSSAVKYFFTDRWWM